MRTAIFLSIAVILSLTASAQNEIDALRFSYTQTPGSARSLGMGGAFGALGADMSSFWLNPGGIGLYKRGGVECSLTISDMGSKSSYEGQAASNGSASLTVQGLGFYATRATRHPQWKSLTFGIAYGKLNNFNENYSVRGRASNTTLLDVFAGQAYGVPYELVSDELPFGAGLAWNTYLIDPDPNDSLGYVPVVDPGITDQSKRLVRTGNMSETAFAMGANYMDWLYVGATINFVGIRYGENTTYTEQFEVSEPLAEYSFSEDLSVSGIGVGIKLGAVARATEWLRLGAAWHSRTALGISDTYSADMVSQFRDGTSYEWESPVNLANYSLRSPSRWLGSVAFILGDAGVISADYEFADYGSIRMKGMADNNYDYEQENEAIRTVYRSTHKARAGVELRIASKWRGRVGAQYAQSPFVKAVNNNSPYLSWSGGGGYRHKRIYADLAVMFTQRTEDYFLYDPSRLKPASIDTHRVSVILSGGFRF